MLFEIVTTLCSGFFSGAAIYVSFVEHPARIEAGTEIAIAEFRPSYKRGAIMQTILALATILGSVGAWLGGSGAFRLIGGLCLGLAIPFTLIVIFPTNRKLLDPGLNRNSAETQQLLARWGKLHALRSLLGAISFILFVLLLAA